MFCKGEIIPLIITIPTHIFVSARDAIYEVIALSYISPNMKEHFETLSIDLKNEVLSRDVQINSLTDLIKVLEQIVEQQ